MAAEYSDQEDLAARVACRLNALFQWIRHPESNRPWLDGEVAAVTGVSRDTVEAFRMGMPLETIHPDPPTETLPARLTGRLAFFVERDGRAKREIASAAGFSAEYLAKLLKGQSLPTMGKVEDLAGALGVDPSDLSADSLGVLARHFERSATCQIPRRYLTYADDHPDVQRVTYHLADLEAYRRLEKNLVGVSFRNTAGRLGPGALAEIAAIVERRVKDLPPEEPGR
ncbi:helix-turn-helix domain-containing protein [Streptomyces luteireticuli]|uniref:helix-turn-helix domain-containing protein n=1 Tax=Streptomyces luteireticuli TaxID=173858 RepID=UPI0035573A87